MFAKIKRLYYTLSPLKLEQFWGLFYYRVIRRLFPFKAVTVLPTSIEQLDVRFQHYQSASWLGGNTFKFLNHTASINEQWQTPEQSMLWLYNLHYFDDLFAIDTERTSAEQKELILDWWQVHQPQQGIAWDPYPTSLRAVNLCKWHWLNNADFSLIIEQEFSQLLARHYVEIKRKLEYHLQANHLFANLKALWFLQAALPEYRHKDSRWLQAKLLKELAIQFDADGGHFELSPMYHRIMLWDVMDMLAVAQQVADFSECVEPLQAVAEQGLTWMQALAHPDTEVAFFNDGSFGIAPIMERLESYAGLLELQHPQPQNARYSGYVVQKLGSAKLICDVASVGPTFQPGHAHADTLSFEFSIGKQRVFVNSGTSEYGASAERLRQRSTAAHNTVELAGKNSSDVWSGFRVGKAAQAKLISLVQTEASLNLEASHDGYSPSLHKRSWQLAEGSLLVKDELAAAQNKTSYFHLHPEVEVKAVDSNKYLLSWQDGEAEVSFVGGTSTIHQGTWHPEFGVVMVNQFIKLDWQENTTQMQVSW